MNTFYRASTIPTHAIPLRNATFGPQNATALSRKQFEYVPSVKSDQLPKNNLTYGTAKFPIMVSSDEAKEIPAKKRKQLANIQTTEKVIKKAKKEISQEPRYWLNVVSLDHVQKGMEGEFTQACHGKKSALEKMKKGDGIVHYSPKMMMEGNVKCNKFTSIGRIADDRIYAFDMGGGFVPHRRDVTYEKDVQHVSIKPLLSRLSFSKDKGNKWGMALRAGLISITAEDFELISRLMKEGVVNFQKLT